MLRSLAPLAPQQLKTGSWDTCNAIRVFEAIIKGYELLKLLPFCHYIVTVKVLLSRTKYTMHF